MTSFLLLAPVSVKDIYALTTMMGRILNNCITGLIILQITTDFYFVKCISCKSASNYIASHAVVLSVTYSASVDDNDTVACFLILQRKHYQIR